MHRNERPTRAYTRYFTGIGKLTSSQPQRIDWQICGEVVGISVSVAIPARTEPVACCVLEEMKDWVDLAISVDAGKDSLATDGQQDVPIPFSHLVPWGGGPNMAPWLRYVSRQSAYSLTVRNRHTVEDVNATVTIWVREGVNPPIDASAADVVPIRKG